ncbi:ABC transporter permease [Leptospira interrogans]
MAPPAVISTTARSGLLSRSFALNVLGLVGLVVLWYGLVRWSPFQSFNRLPDPLQVIREWLSPDPTYGLSLFTESYWTHVYYSTYRAYAAFGSALLLGLPLGILMGWKDNVRQYAQPLITLLRPVPPLAWVPIAILIMPTTEVAVIFVTFLVAFYATVMNTLVGVRSIPEDYYRAAQSLGASNRDVLWDVIVPGALPQIFTGLQIAMGAAWFSLVAGEMIASQYGLGFLIWEAYNLIQYPTIVIGMATLGAVGYLSSALVRWVGRRLMAWRSNRLGVTA